MASRFLGARKTKRKKSNKKLSKALVATPRKTKKQSFAEKKMCGRKPTLRK